MFRLARLPSLLSSRLFSSSSGGTTSAAWVEAMHEKWLRDPNTVDPSWRDYFDAVAASGSPLSSSSNSSTFSNTTSSSSSSSSSGSSGYSNTSAATTAAGAATATQPAGRMAPPPALDGAQISMMHDSMKATLLARSYAVRGHFLAQCDPLGLARPAEVPAELDLGYYGWTEADLDRPIYVGDATLGAFASDTAAAGWRSLRELRDLLHRSYCGNIGFEFMHIAETDIINWMRKRVEQPVPFAYSKEEKLVIYDRLAWATLLERFLGRKFQEKRFGLDGSESFVVGLKALIDRASQHNVQAVNLGMAHRGRLNVLANVVRKPLEAIFAEFHGRSYLAEDWGSSGDVKYHLGTSYNRPTRVPGRRVALSLLANPSHLEAVNPLVEGKTYAKQFYTNDKDKKSAMSVLVHGDASFAGQGVVFETLNLSTLADYSTGGCVHIIINNQIGFTTLPHESRSGVHCTDVAKSIGAPILHVNGDDPEAVNHCLEIAADFRAEFGRDIVVDVVGYRRHGHNEVDQPKFTQPVMYSAIEKHPTSLELYEQKLMAEGVLTEEEVAGIKSKIEASMSAALERSSTYVTNRKDWLESRWRNFFPTRPSYERQSDRVTGATEADLRQVSECLTNIPAGFHVHKALARILKNKKQALETGKGIDWATAEALAFGTLALEGTHVRLSGQDVERGTFSQRHAVIHDQESGESFTPLQHLRYDQAKVHVCNSSLSEFAVLGFETGFSMESPYALVMWEAQFGDFVNGAQVIIDQFITSGEKKWMRQCGVVLLLPHGYEGAGPEHSSCRPERFLMAYDQNPLVEPHPGKSDPRLQIQKANIQVVNPTTPAQYFHVLRRQVQRPFRKPLVVLTPKSLLKHREAVSDLSEMSFDMANAQDRFQLVLPEVEPEAIAEPEKITDVVFCTGKVYYDVRAHRREQGLKHFALVRMEQLAPFPFDQVKEVAAQYPNAQITWCQEEPFNMGYYHHVYFNMVSALGKERAPRYVGRPAAASPAAGSMRQHKVELAAFLEQLDVPSSPAE